VPIITAWRGDRLPSYATEIDLWADEAEEELLDFLPEASDGLGGKRDGHHATRLTAAPLKARQVWQSV
jgi:hypothetical protein